MLLELCITHWNEPWEVGKKFFDMLGMQRGADFSQVRVTVIHDGTEAFPEDCFSGYPYKVRQIRIEHGGISTARNAGIENADAKWIQFCDFDDMYAGVYSLRNIMNVLDTNDYDMLWSKFYAEDIVKTGRTVLHLRGENTVFIHGKVFRTAWLKESGLRFDTEMTFNEDSAFCTIADLMIPKERKGEITCEAPPYVWCYREGSATGSQINKVQAIIGAWHRDRTVTDAFRKYAPKERYAAMVARTVCDAYWMMCLENVPDELKPYADEFGEWFRRHQDVFYSVSEADMDEVYSVSLREHEIAVQEEEQRWGDDGKTTHRDIPMWRWLRELLEEKG